MDTLDTPADDLSLKQAATVAGCSAKTLRRAIAKGALPRRYRPGNRGAELVLNRQDLGAWQAERVTVDTIDTMDTAERLTTNVHAGQALSTRQDWTAAVSRVAALEAAVAALQEELAVLRAERDTEPGAQRLGTFVPIVPPVQAAPWWAFWRRGGE